MPPRQAILFLIDTQGTNCVGAYGNPALHTPHVDRLASSGMRFDRAHTCSPVCGPARSAILTGLYPHSNGVLANDQAPHLDVPTIGQRMHAHGIPAACIGKWHLDGSDYFGDGRCPPGWDSTVWFDGRNYLESLTNDQERDLSRQVLSPDAIAQHGITADFTHAHRTADRAIDYIARHRDQDYLLVVSIDEPHHPFICPEPFVSLHQDFLLPLGPSADDDLAAKPRSQQEWSAFQANLRARSVVRDTHGASYRNPAYFGCNSYSDSEVGRVLDAVDAHAPCALVAYTADHGDMFFAHGLTGKGPVMYDEITRIPLIMRWPGHVPPATVSNHPVSHIDLTPTLLEFFDLPVPDLLQGTSLLPTLRNPAVIPNEAVFMEFNRLEIDHDGFGAFSPIRCVTDGQHKLAVNLLDSDELYNLRIDPAEMVNLIDDPATASIRDGLHDQLLDWMGRTRDPLRGPHWGRRPWRKLSTSSWGGPTRPRPFDTDFYPATLLYDTGRPITQPVYDKN